MAQPAWGSKAFVITSPIQEKRETGLGMQAKHRGCCTREVFAYTSSIISRYTSSTGRPFCGIPFSSRREMAAPSAFRNTSSRFIF